jgi:uncharacterized surface protein with fasciclin (FAS1) repeats
MNKSIKSIALPALFAAVALPALFASAALTSLAHADTMMTTSGSMMATGTMMHSDTMMKSDTMTTTSGAMMTSDSMMTATADLSYGSRGEAVVSLQTWLVKKGLLTIPEGVAMGYFGPLTEAALITYQTSVGLPAHGYFGALTRAKVNSEMAMMHSGSSSMTGSATMTDTSGGVMVGGALMVPNKDIVQNAVNASNVTTVVAAVKAAGLVATLESAGPFTVFAPNNDAFAKLPAGTVDTLLKPESLATLKDILTYHVVAGRYTSADLTDGMTLTTVEGKKIKINKSASGQITVNGTAMVQTANVISSNGVTFVIDTVLTPTNY